MMLSPADLQPLLAAARHWADEDPDPVTTKQLRELIEQAGGGAQVPQADEQPTEPSSTQRERAQLELADSFHGTLQFGTAGLRAKLGAGPNRMNRVVVRRTAAGLATFLLDQAANPAARGSATGGGPAVKDGTARGGPGYVPRAVIGFDARHNSEVFATETAAIFTAAGVETFLLPSALPTPVLAYAVRALDCEGGVMVTASHNPPQDNGYKVYLGGRVVLESARGAQIVGPFDAEITARIDAVGPLSGITLASGGWTVLDAPDTGAAETALLVQSADGGLVNHAADAGLVARAAMEWQTTVGPDAAGKNSAVPDAPRPDAAQTGGAPASPANQGLVADYESAVRALLDPGLFPARDLKIILTPMHGVGGKTAVSVLTGAGFDDVTLVTAQAEPDPDFPTVAFPNPEEPGALDLALAAARDACADIVLATDPDADRAAVAAVDPSTGSWRMLTGDEVGSLLGAHMAVRGSAGATVFANSIVSSRLLARIAAKHGFAHAETLTGFKWISRVSGLVYGYEEALGYCVAPELVRDKDGISAILLIAELAATAKAAGRSLFDALDDLAMEHGLHASDQLSIRVADLGLLETMMTRLRRSPPVSFGGSAIASAVDLSQRSPTAGSAALPPTDALVYLTEDGSRVIIRPSGTEPKLKCYLEVIIPINAAEQLPAARAQARAALDAVLKDVRTMLGHETDSDPAE